MQHYFLVATGSVTVYKIDLDKPYEEKNWKELKRYTKGSFINPLEV